MKRLFIFWISLAMTTNVFCQNHKFEKIAIKSTILNSDVYDLLQDRNGFIWIGGPDGLGRFDGHNVVEFRHYKNIKNSICNNQISSLDEAPDGKIWIGTKGGLSVYDPVTESTRCLFLEGKGISKGDNILLKVLTDRKGYVWYSTYNGLYRFDPRTEERKVFLPDVNDSFSISTKLVYSIFEDKAGILWFATNKGIAFYKNDDTYQFENVPPEPSQPFGLKHKRFFSFCQTANGDLWVGGDSGFYKILESNGKLQFINFSHDGQNGNSLSYDFVNHLLADKNNLWVSTWAGGLNNVVLDEGYANPVFTHYRNEKNNSNSLATDEVNTTLIDKSGVLWVGTGFGLMKSSPSAKKFGLFQAKPNVPSSLTNNKVQSTLVDSEGNLWVGTDNGLNFRPAEYEKQDCQFLNFKHDPKHKNSLAHNNIFDIYEDSSHRIWIATYDGFSIANLNSFYKKKSFKNLKFKEFPHKWIYNILETEKDVFWISTYGKLAKMYFPIDAVEPTFEIFDMDPEDPNALSNATTYQTCKDSRGRIWVATYFGLSMIEEGDNCTVFANYYKDQQDSTSISDETINCLFLDSNGHFWIGTRNGLNLYVEDQKGSRFLTFDESYGLPNSVINFIEEGIDGMLLIGTEDGVVQFDSKKAVRNESPVVNVYSFHDGLGKNNTVVRSSCKSEDGTIFFGSEGLNFFNPRDLVFNKNIPDLIFTKLKVLNKEISASDNKILKKSISNPDAEINLRHDDNMIEIFFSCLDFSKPEKNKYKYKMEGINLDWVDSGNKNYATYTNLEAGSYFFHVIGSNNDGIWNNNPISLKINVKPYWSKSMLAYIMYTLLGVTILGLFYRWRKVRAKEKIKIIKDIEIARLEEREQLRKQNAADFHDELGHRLTKIALFLEIAKKQVGENEKLNEYLEKVKSNTKSLSEGLKDLIWSLDPKKDTVLDTVNRIQEMGDNIFDYSEMKFSTNAVDDNFRNVKLSPTERKHILLIFKEAMNNTLKYSSADQCGFNSELHNGSVLLVFKDNGIGFDIKTLKYGNGLKNMKDRVEKIGARLTIESEPNNGTTIIVSFPENNKNLMIKSI